MYVHGYVFPKQLSLDSKITSWGLTNRIPRQFSHIFSNSEVYVPYPDQGHDLFGFEAGCLPFSRNVGIVSKRIQVIFFRA